MGIIKLGVADSNAPNKKHAFDIIDNVKIDVKADEKKQEVQKTKKLKSGGTGH